MLITNLGNLHNKRMAALLFCFQGFHACLAIGSIAHNYVAEQVAVQLKEANTALYEIIEKNWNEYLVGSDYPDTGYMLGATYGEISHWQPFVDAYITYLHEQYPIPSLQRDKLLAFLMGICTHIQSDITAHWTYYDLVATYDFDNLPNPGAAWNIAHEYMDPATDFYVIVNKHIYNHPTKWWVPVDDLVAVYKIMNKDIPAEQIIQANIIYYLAVGIDETLIALPAYWYDKYVAIPWGISHLETPDTNELRYGAFPGQVNDSALYLTKIWNHYTKENTFSFDFTEQQSLGRSSRPWLSQTVPWVEKAILQKSVRLDPTVDSTGNVIFSQEPLKRTLSSFHLFCQ